jgi:hypothetical protein
MCVMVDHLDGVLVRLEEAGDAGTGVADSRGKRDITLPQ